MFCLNANGANRHRDQHANVKEFALACRVRFVNVASWVAVCMLLAPAVSQGETPRVTEGLLALYTFDETSGKIVRDQSGTGEPLDLQINDEGAVQRDAGRVTIRRSTLIASPSAATKIIDAVKRTNELTIEAWIRPANVSQEGPARLVTLSRDTSHRNFTVGQEANRFDVRLRTTKTSVNGMPSIPTAARSASPELTHIVFTRSRDGQATIYLNAATSANRKVDGDLSRFDANYRFALGNELTADRPWLGELHLVAIYDRALSTEQVKANFAAGAAATVSPELAAQRKRLAAAAHFETKVAPILARRCVECHDTVNKEGGLDLSRQQGLLAGGEGGKVLVAGKPLQSTLWTQVAEDKMPQDREPLTAKEKADLRRWLEGGAVWSLDVIDPAIYRNDERAGKNWVQRLTVDEYVATVKATVGVDISDQAEKVLPPDLRADGFNNTAYNLGVDLKHIQAYASLSETIVQRMDVNAFARRFTKSQKLTDDNMIKLVDTMGLWLLRGPLSTQEVASFRGIGSTVASAGGDFEQAVGLIVQAMLQSPRFIYRIENQTRRGERWQVGPYELASRISYIVWGGPPDAELYRAAKAGELTNRAKVVGQLKRMLADPRAQQRSLQFATQWLNLSRLENLQPNRKKFPDWQPELAADMRAETLEFFRHIVWKQQRPLTDLLNAQVTFATPRLAKHYGMTTRPDSKGELAGYDLSRVPARGGLLTQGSLLTMGGDDASMVTRGLFVLEDLLFSEVGDPPPGLDTSPVPASPGKSNRVVAQARIANQACGGCHRKFEPLAFGLERFDGLGAYRERDEHGNPLREDGEIRFPGEEKPVTYKTSAELMNLLADSDRVSRGITRKVTQFALGRPVNAADAKSIEEIHTAAQQGGGTYACLISAIILSDLVQQGRRIDAGE